MQTMRVAFEAARTTVAASESDELHGWFADQLGWIFGPEVEQDFNDSRARLLWPAFEPNPDAEKGCWRVRYERLLGERPEREEALLRLVTQARTALADLYHGLLV
jgi:hypothetical protein